MAAHQPGRFDLCVVMPSSAASTWHDDCVSMCVCVLREGKCLHVRVCLRAGVSVSVSLRLYRCEFECGPADMDIRAFNGAVGQHLSDVDAPIYVCRALCSCSEDGCYYIGSSWQVHVGP